MEGKKFFFGNKQIYLYFEEKKFTNSQQIYIEGEEDSSITKKYYIDEKSKKWVKDCKNTESGFHDSKKCVDKCGNKYIVDDTFECVNNCNKNEGNYFIDEETNICFKNCP